MKTLKDFIDGGGELTINQRLELWESKSKKDVLDFPIGEMNDEQIGEILDQLDVPRKLTLIGDEMVMSGGKYKSDKFPYIVVEKNINGEYSLIQVDNKNDWYEDQYKLLRRYPIIGL